MEPVVVIVNPTARRGHRRTRLDDVALLFRDVGLRAEIVQTEGPGHATELAQQAKRAGRPTVVAAGGDGTVNEVVNGLLNARRTGEPAGTLAVLPIGSGNDFAAHLRIPKTPTAAVRVISHGEKRRMDVGLVTLHAQAQSIRRYFNNSMGLGLEAAVTLASQEIHRLRGRLLYLAAAFKTLPRAQAVPMELMADCADGHTWQRHAPTVMVTIGNSPRSGGGFHLTPGACVDDGVLDAGVAAAVSTWRLFTLLPKALWGKHIHDSAVTMLRIRSLRVAVPDGVPVQLDGEIVARAATEICVDVVPACLDVIVPHR